MVPVDGERPLVAGHVGVHVAGVDVVHHDVRARVCGHLALLDAGERGPADLGHEVG